jgi:hypothetical protein
VNGAQESVVLVAIAKSTPDLKEAAIQECLQPLRCTRAKSCLAGAPWRMGFWRIDASHAN